MKHGFFISLLIFSPLVSYSKNQQVVSRFISQSRESNLYYLTEAPFKAAVVEKITSQIWNSKWNANTRAQKLLEFYFANTRAVSNAGISMGSVLTVI